jgi:aminoglycoside phosphotransferase (APT) family kinase protein
MSTIGHPLSDLVNLLNPYSLKDRNEVKHLPKFREGQTPGLPTQQQLLKWYAEIAGWDPSPDMAYGVAFGFFRATCIYQGIAARYAVRQASSAKAKDNATQRHPMGKLAWEYVQKSKAAATDKPRL